MACATDIPVTGKKKALAPFARASAIKKKRLLKLSGGAAAS